MAILQRFTRRGRSGATRANQRGGYPSWQQQLPTYAEGAALAAGGYANTKTGAGTERANSLFAQFVPTRGLARNVLDVTYVQSWAAKKLINIPVDDAISRWRDWDQADSDLRQALIDAEEKHKVKKKVRQAFRGARLYGATLLLVLTKGDNLESELDPERVRQDSLLNLLPVDRYCCTVDEINLDIFNDHYGQPQYYTVTLPDTPLVRVHHSRVLRFDGIAHPIAGRWESYDSHWGVSELVPTVAAIMQHTGVAADIAQLVDEASISVVKMRRFREAIAGNSDPEAAGPFDTLLEVLRLKSIFRTLVLDEKDEYNRVNVPFAGLPELMDRYAHLVAATADIPMTRFYNTPPKGMDATGESDERNYAMLIKELQERVLDDPLKHLDLIIARDAGITDKLPKYEWRSLIEMSDFDIAEVTAMKANAVNTSIAAGWLDEREARAIMSGNGKEVLNDGSRNHARPAAPTDAMRPTLLAASEWGG